MAQQQQPRDPFDEITMDQDGDNEDEEYLDAYQIPGGDGDSSSDSASATPSPVPPPPDASSAPPSQQQQQPQMMEHYKIRLTFEPASCAWCTEQLEIGNGIVLQDCFHTFCRNCLVEYINSCTLTEVKCPLSESCCGNIYDSEIKALLKPADYEAHNKKSLAAAMTALPNMFSCKSPSCSGWCQYELDSKVFLCPGCNKKNCIPCKAIHDGIDCDQYQRLIQQAIASGKNVEEAQVAVQAQLGSDGFEQLVGTVAEWMSNSSISNNNSNGNGPTFNNARVSQQYSAVFAAMASQELWISNKEFTCPICFDTVPAGSGVIFECLHSFCRDCAVGVVQHSTEPLINCPYQDPNYSCTYILKEREVRALVPPALFQTHLARSVQQAESAMANTFHCKTPDCTGWCEYEAGTTHFTCLICGKTNCLSCGLIHEGLSCEDYKNRAVQNVNDVKSTEAVEAMIASGQAMRCSNCSVAVEKSAGCDWLQCTCCKTELCWATKGPRWGPKGRGDTSGGCHCKENGKLCHPNCGNCH